MSNTQLQTSKILQSDQQLLRLELHGRGRNWLLGHLDLESGTLLPAANLDIDYLNAVLAASGTSVAKLLTQHHPFAPYELDARSIFPDFPHFQVRAIGGMMVPAVYRVVFAARCDNEGSWQAYYSVQAAAADGLFPLTASQVQRQALTTAQSPLEAGYLALATGVVETISRVRRSGAQPHAAAVDIWGDSEEVIAQVRDEKAPAEPVLREYYASARGYLQQFRARRLSWHAANYTTTFLGILVFL